MEEPPTPGGRLTIHTFYILLYFEADTALLIHFLTCRRGLTPLFLFRYCYYTSTTATSREESACHRIHTLSVIRPAWLEPRPLMIPRGKVRPRHGRR